MEVAAKKTQEKEIAYPHSHRLKIPAPILTMVEVHRQIPILRLGIMTEWEEHHLKTLVRSQHLQATAVVIRRERQRRRTRIRILRRQVTGELREEMHRNLRRLKIPAPIMRLPTMGVTRSSSPRIRILHPQTTMVVQHRRIRTQAQTIVVA